MKRWSLITSLLILLGAWSVAARAHDLTIAEMEVRQLAPGEFTWQWTVSGNLPPGEDLKPVWPEGCNAEEYLLHCAAAGLRGTLTMEGIGKHYSAAIVKVFWLDGEMRAYTMTSAQPAVHLSGSGDDARGWSEVAATYTILGIEHILTGYDHLLFVLALLFLVGFNRRLLWTITAFTVAHSVTLALSALGWLTLRAAPVEATIALSIVLVAGEAMHKEATLSRRFPAVVAFLFGLVHGLGFAGALKEIGLPQNHLSVALLTFNVGVELGQVLVIAVAYAVYRTLAGWPRLVLARLPALYAIGSVAAYWSIGRVASILL